MAAYEVADARRSLLQEVTVSWTRLRDLGPVAELDRQTYVALAEQAAAIEREYDAGLVTLTELIEARQDEHQARLTEIETRYELLEERLRLLQLTARLANPR
jgi:outer membrane protein TolC